MFFPALRFSLVKYTDEVCAFNGGQTVRFNHRSTVFHQIIERFLYHIFRFGVRGRKWLRPGSGLEGFLRMARAMLMRWRCPPESLLPRSFRLCFHYPFSVAIYKSWALAILAAFSTCSGLACDTPKKYYYKSVIKSYCLLVYICPSMNDVGFTKSLIFTPLKTPPSGRGRKTR